MMQAIESTPARSNARRREPDRFATLGAELDAIRDRILTERGEEDAQYIRKIVRLGRSAEASGRALLFMSPFPPAFAAGVGLLALSKILDNMEIGHNVMHGQYDWMKDPSLSSTRYEWDAVSTRRDWMHSHNAMHHVFTNVVGKDRDVGYGFLRVCDDQAWTPLHLIQPFTAATLMLNFEWGIGLHDLELDRVFLSGERSVWGMLRQSVPVAKKAARQVFKDYIAFPALAGPMFPLVFAGNALANVTRNVWAFWVIFCGHFPEGVQTYREEDLQDESRGGWYARQVGGSANFDGPRWLHILSGHLSHQIEHHIFPDLPAWRYPQIAAEVRSICERHGIRYNTASFGTQVRSVVKQLFRLALPGRRTPVTP